MDPRIAWFAGALLSTMLTSGAIVAQSAPPAAPPPPPPGYPYAAPSGYAPPAYPPYPAPSAYPPPAYAPYGAPPGYPPPGYAPYPAPSGYPPPGSYYPPPAYPPPPGYGAPVRAEAKPTIPAELDDEGQPIPAGYHRGSKVHKAGVIGGAILAGTAYVISATVAATSTDSTDRGLFVPYFGPIIALLSKPTCAALDSSCVNVKTMLTFDVIAQLTGTAVFIYSVASPRSIFVRDEVGAQAPTRWMLVPTTFGKDSAGLGYLSTF